MKSPVKMSRNSERNGDTIKGTSNRGSTVEREIQWLERESVSEQEINKIQGKVSQILQPFFSDTQINIIINNKKSEVLAWRGYSISHDTEKFKS